MPKLFGQDKLGEYRSLEVKVVRNSSDVRDYENIEFLMVSNRELPQVSDSRTEQIKRESFMWHTKLNVGESKEMSAQLSETDFHDDSFIIHNIGSE